MDRLDINSMYGGNTIQEGGDPRSPKSKDSKKHTYSPPDVDKDTTNSISKLFKENRLLQKELDKVKQELAKEKVKTSMLENQINATRI